MHSERTGVRGMAFSCSRSWEGMAPMEGGRFCDGCQKPVIDFTGWDQEELIRFFRARPHTCGHFEAHQVDPTLIPVATVTRGLRRGFLASIAALTITAGEAQTMGPRASTEQVIHDPAAGDALTGRCERIPHVRGHKEPDSKSWVITPARSPNRRMRVYLSARFPFIHIRHRTVRGRRALHTLGCPSF